MNYFKVTRYLQKGDKTLFEIPLEDQKAFLNRLGNANGIVDRGFKQYLCQMDYSLSSKVFFLNIISALLFPIALVYYLVKGTFVKKNKKVDAILERKGMNEVLPSFLSFNYQLNDECWEAGSSLSIMDLGFVFSLIKTAGLHPYFVFKVMMNLALYSDMIRKNDPSAIIQFGEFSFSRTTLTEYCHRNHVQHINIQHGEKLFYMRDAFFCFDVCYVWNQHYVELFTLLKAEPSQFVVYLPESLKIDIEKNHNPMVYANYKYYLADNSEEEIKSIVKSMAFLKSKGKTVKYRPHPRYTDIIILQKYVDAADIEPVNSVSILESVANLQFAVGSYTTVLLQAFFAGKKVVLDDVTYKAQYEQLDSLMYFLSKHEHVRLSDLQY
jgi:hypothetical protein